MPATHIAHRVMPAGHAVCHTELPSRWSILLTLRNLTLPSTIAAGGTLAGIGHWLNWRWPVPHYYFDTKNGHRLVDRSGLEFKNDAAAIARAKVIAIGVSLDKPAVDPKRHIAVLNGSGEQIFSVPVYSKPSMSNTWAFASLRSDERNGTKRSRREPQSDRRALHPPSSET
jgi:hypothetical protein